MIKNGLVRGIVTTAIVTALTVGGSSASWAGSHTGSLDCGTRYINTNTYGAGNHYHRISAGGLNVNKSWYSEGITRRSWVPGYKFTPSWYTWVDAEMNNGNGASCVS